jgi:enoyl-CoA hydratase/carnithine racemase
MQADGSVRVEKHQDGVAVITLDRPDRLNALTAQMMAELGAAYADLDDDADVRAIVVTGAGRAFCAGADMRREGGAFSAVDDVSSFRSSPVRPTAFEIDKPVIAAINGHAVGIGMTLALQCDLRFMAADCKWGVVQVRRGMVGDAHVHHTLVRAVGTARAAEILLTGAMFTGDDALRLGVASRVLPAAGVLPAAVDVAREIATEAAPRSVTMSKRILRASALGASAADVDELERLAHLLLMGSDDAAEGGKAFLERRSPNFAGKVPDDLPADGPFAKVRRRHAR